MIIKQKPQKYFSKYKKPLAEFPNLLETQLVSYRWLIEKGIQEIFEEFSPIEDYSGKKFILEFKSFILSEPKYDENHAKLNKLSYDSALKVRVKLTNKSSGTIKEQEMFLTDFPLMTNHGTFIINGVERVVVPQLMRSFGIFFNSKELKGKKYFGAKIIPSRGVWIEIESDSDETLQVRVDRKRKFSLISLLRIMGFETNEAILDAFKDSNQKEIIKFCIEKDHSKTIEKSYIEVYKRLRDGDLATPEHAREFIDSILSTERYDLSPVGRFQFNKRFNRGLDLKELERRTLSKEDLITIISYILNLNTTLGAKEDDIDHLAHRRLRYVGEMLQQKIRKGMTQIKRNIQDKMSTVDIDTAVPIQIINQRPLQARIKEFFTTNQLAQFMSQENILSEIEHLRTLSALGPGGLTRERAGFEVRDVHTSHYGRVCPIQTPEGPNIGLILRLSTYARINDFGIIEAPYVRVKNGKITGEIVYLNALEEEMCNIAHARLNYDDKGKILIDKVEARRKTHPGLVKKDEIDFIDVATNQAFSIATSMIPFLEHDDANRALMGSNMQRQATPCLIPDEPLVATGMEKLAAPFS